MSAQVLISGAGPVGMTLAVELTRLGVPVRIIDKSPGRTGKSRALVLWSRSLELFEPSGLAERFVATGNPVTHTTFMEGQKPIGTFRLDQLESPYAYALMVPQTETERLLEAHLAESGIRIERNTTLLDFEQDGAGVTARLLSETGEIETLNTPWLVGCDGAHSAIRHQLGLAFEGYAEPVEWALADVYLPDSVPGDQLQVSLHPAGVLALFPMGQHRFRLIADLGVAEAGPDTSELTLAQLQAMIDARGRPDLVARDPQWLSRFRINERKVADYRKGRIFLAGDAAHIHSPAGGQGMNTGMQDAFNLAWKLALVVKGAAKEALLDTYSPERSPIAELVLRNAGGGTKAVTLSNPLARSTRNFVLGAALKIPAVQRRVGKFLSELDVAYPKSPLSVTGEEDAPSIGVKPGQRVGSEIFGISQQQIGQSGKWILIGSTEDVTAIAAEFPALVDAAQERREPGLWLVRPDGYLGFAGAAGDVAGARNYLRRIA
ncbi:FAD-dependent monooxygenase [Rhizobium oryzicola]|uniref:FAD-dependent monooxygenase n=1 Tax=Rhizobium oryzicola TaxID=1232668 RepID=A0ABT8SV99_9HYPH|nr:FAD-dependent monooxygenase [Rhizobium oryzicola]MDO1582369.1 FAD-dependent monooxygenase [Rhizobium oryzicola]